jgi:hypothetical protein
MQINSNYGYGGTHKSHSQRESTGNGDPRPLYHGTTKQQFVVQLCANHIRARQDGHIGILYKLEDKAQVTYKTTGLLVNVSERVPLSEAICRNKRSDDLANEVYNATYKATVTLGIWRNCRSKDPMTFETT